MLENIIRHLAFKREAGKLHSGVQEKKICRDTLIRHRSSKYQKCPFDAICLFLQGGDFKAAFGVRCLSALCSRPKWGRDWNRVKGENDVSLSHVSQEADQHFPVSSAPRWQEALCRFSRCFMQCSQRPCVTPRQTNLQIHSEGLGTCVPCGYITSGRPSTPGQQWTCLYIKP